MAYIIANKDGTSNAKVGDKVITGGGVYEKMADGSSRKVDSLPTLSGKTTSYTELQNIFSRIQNATGQSGSGGGGGSYAPEVIESHDTPWNDDFFTGDNFGSDFSGGGGGDFDGSKIFGYVIVALVGIVVIDKLLG